MRDSVARLSMASPASSAALMARSAKPPSLIFLEGVVMLAQALDLLVHLGVGRAFRRKLHLDGLVAGKL